MTDLLGLLAKITNSTSVDEVWALFVERMTQYGFSRVNYGFTRCRSDHSIGKPEDAVYLSNNSAEYLELYFKDGFFSKTPVFRWCMENVGITTWRWVEQDLKAGRLSETEAEAVKANRKMGVFAGLSISFPATSPRSKAAMGLTADKGLTHDDVDRIWASHGLEIQVLCNTVHLQISSLPMKLTRRRLTRRQREALEWVADGKTAQDIATLMGVSSGTVEKHLRLARETLGVETTAHAVAKASVLNQIFARD